MIRTWWSGCVLAGWILVGCGDHDRPNLVTGPEPEIDAGQQELPTDDAGEPDAQGPVGSDAGQTDPENPARTTLAPVETPFTGQTQTAKSRSYTMVSRLAAPIGAAAAGEGTEYRMLTGVIALQGGAEQ